MIALRDRQLSRTASSPRLLGSARGQAMQLDAKPLLATPPGGSASRKDLLVIPAFPEATEFARHMAALDASKPIPLPKDGVLRDGDDASLSPPSDARWKGASKTWQSPFKRRSESPPRRPWSAGSAAMRALDP